MDQTPDQIADEIGRTRRQLGSNLQELEARVDAATDWREYYRAAPWLCVGAAAVGGVLAARMTRGHGPQQEAPRVETGFGSTSLRRSKLGSQVIDTWDGVQYALVGVAAAKLTDYLSELVPGFRDHYQRRA